MITSEASQVGTLVERLDDAVVAGSVEAISSKIKDVLTDLISSGGLELPERYQDPRPECYARRLLHRDPELRYSVVVMTWGPGQGTPLHDHSGMWCVEAVVSGRMEVTQFHKLEENGSRYRFQEAGRINAGPGSSGSLIPPYEYHILRNSFADTSSITVHVYGGEMDHCSAFMPEEDGWHLRQQRPLAYHD